jgi:hypothetical protein
MAKGTVCKEDVVRVIVLDCFRIELDGLVEMVRLELFVCLRFDLLRLGNLCSTRRAPTRPATPRIPRTSPPHPTRPQRVCTRHGRDARAIAPSASRLHPGCITPDACLRAGAARSRRRLRRAGASPGEARLWREACHGVREKWHAPARGRLREPAGDAPRECRTCSGVGGDRVLPTTVVSSDASLSDLSDMMPPWLCKPLMFKVQIGAQRNCVWSKVLGYVDPAKSGRRTVSGEDRDDGGGPPRETSTWHRTGRPEGVSPRAWRRGSPLHMPYDAAVPRLQCAWRPTGVGDSRSAAGRMVDRQ